MHSLARRALRLASNALLASLLALGIAPAPARAQDDVARPPSTQGASAPGTQGAQAPRTGGASDPSTRGAQDPSTRGATAPAQGAAQPPGAAPPATGTPPGIPRFPAGPEHATPAAPPGKLDETAALAKVSSLPEVDAAQKELARAKVRLVIRRDDDGSGPRMEFAIAEDHADHQVTRYRFGVDAATGALSAYQVECDLWAPLEKWRALRKKLSAMKPAERDAVDTCDELSK